MGDCNYLVVKLMYPDRATLTRTGGPPMSLVPLVEFGQLVALKNAVTRLGEARDLWYGISRAELEDGWGMHEAFAHFLECVEHVLAARAALDAGEG